MASYEDLSPCDYFSGPRYRRLGEPEGFTGFPELLAVGWLERGHAYPVGRTAPDLIPRLRGFRESPTNPLPMYFGWQDCDFCDRPIGGSSLNVLVPSCGSLYVAPGGIDHYIAAHEYQPPEIFVAAVLAAPAPDSNEHMAALKAAGWPEAWLPINVAREIHGDV